MTSATLYREAADLDELLAELDAEFPGRVRVVDIARPRAGGFLGFFAKQRVGVHYRLLDHDAAVAGHTASQADAAASAAAQDDAAGAAGDAVGGATGDAPQAGTGGDAVGGATADAPQAGTGGDPAENAAGLEFARMLAELALQRAAERADVDSEPQGENDEEPFWSRPNSQPAVTDRSSLLRALQTAARTRDGADPTDTAAGIDLAGRERVLPGRIPPATAEWLRPALSSQGREVHPWTWGAATLDGAAAGTGSATAFGIDPATEPGALSAGDPRVGSSGRDHAIAGQVAGRRTPGGAGIRQHSTSLELRRQLLEAGVPVDRVPADATHAYQAVEQLVRSLPAPPPPPRTSGAILVIAGPARELSDAVGDFLRHTRPGCDVVGTFRCRLDGIGARRPVTLDATAAARDLAAEAREHGTAPVLVAVATDHRGAWGEAGREVIAALEPDAVWAVVDATRKPADTGRMLDRLGPVDALIATHAGETTSPATVWGLGTPVAMLDGAPATPESWAITVLTAVTAAEREQPCSDDRY